MRISTVGLLLVVAMPAAAQDTSTARLPPTVTVARGAAKSPLDLPFGITTVSPDSLRPGQAHVAADQTLAMIPGLTVSNRTNPSQDVRVSVRGFGARSAFGVRSVRILRDGMPLTLPDGQTPLDYLDLESVGRIDVIRGTASALYGNATGGVVDIHSVVPTHPFKPEARVWLGSDALHRTTAVASGMSGAWTYQGNVGRTEADNYRQYSRQRLTNLFGRVAGTIGGTDVSIVGLGLHMPVAENPGALTQAQYDTAPRMADPSSIAKRARKEVDQAQVGVSASRHFGSVALSGAGYGGTRSLYNPLSFAVVGVDRAIAGGSLRADVDIPAVEGLAVTVGGDFQLQDDDRKNWANCNNVALVTANCAVVGVEQGVLEVDQRELVTGGGPYARLELDRGRLHASAGLRADAIRFKVEDAFLSDGDDSGARTLTATSPMAGLAWRFARFASLYSNYTTAFETPTTTELGNQADGSAGLNRDLLPQYSRTVEAGAKGVFGSITYDVAAFHTRVRDELIAFQPPSGRTYYQNAGATRRNGIEVAVLGSGDAIDYGLAYSYSRFRFVDFNSGGAQMKGNAIPGVPEHQLQWSITRRFARSGFVLVEGLSRSRVWANDANSASANGYQVFNARAGRDFAIGPVGFAPTVGVNNAVGTKYVGSVAINATGTATSAPKFFEPAPGRTWIAGARVWFRQ
jgi:iron complex outermembrane receptor protein